MFRKYLICFAVLASLLAVNAFAYTDTPPVNAPFVGSVYITGTTQELGTVTVYLPVTYREGYLGLTSSGNLFNVSNSSISGIMYRGSTEYNFRLSSWSTPQYRLYNSSGYNYSDLTFTSITASNAVIAEEFQPLVPVSALLAYVPIILLGVIVLCLFIKRF